MKLIVIRHLQTEWNQRKVLQGSHDIDILPISDSLKTQIETQRSQIEAKKEPVDLVVTSALKRTQQTARAYGYDKFTVEPLINELNFGPFEGRSRDDLIEHCGEAWFEDPGSIVLGEPMQSLEKRIKLFLEKYQAYRQVLVFAHGSWARALTSILSCGSVKNMNKVVVENNQLLELNDSTPQPV